jgi:intraflagellar transport protein 20
LGERNKVETEEENRKKKMQELNNLINEKRSELERSHIKID